MRSFQLAAIVPDYDIAAELAKGIRLFDKTADIHIREGAGVSGAWHIAADFDLQNPFIRYGDLKILFRNSVEASGGTVLAN